MKYKATRSADSLLMELEDKIDIKNKDNQKVTQLHDLMFVLTGHPRFLAFNTQ